MDEKTYKKQVLDPLRKDKTAEERINEMCRAVAAALKSGDDSALQGILASGGAWELLAMDQATGNLEVHLLTVEAMMKKPGVRFPAKNNLRSMIARLREERKDLFTDPGFWEKVKDQAASGGEAVLENYAAEVAANTVLRIISRAQLKADIHTYRLTATEAQITQALAAEGVTVVGEFPRVTGSYGNVRIGDLPGDYRTVADLLLLEDITVGRQVTGIRVLDELSVVVGGQRRHLGVADIAAAAAFANTRFSDSIEAAKKILTQIGSAAADDRQLKDLLTWALLKEAEKQIAAMPNLFKRAADKLQQLGVDEVDARRLVDHARSQVSAPAAVADTAPPPPPPTGVEATFDAASATVNLRWAPAEEDNIRYRITRLVHAGAVEELLHDGVFNTTTADTNPPAVAQVVYGVAASRDGISFSQPSTVKIVVVTPPREVSTQPEETSCAVSWLAPESAAIQARLLDSKGKAVEVPVNDRGHLQITHLTSGSPYTLQMRCVYDLNGQIIASGPVSVAFTPRSRLRPVENLSAAPSVDGITVRWKPVAGYQVQLWVKETQPTRPPQPVVPAGEFEGRFGELAGSCEPVVPPVGEHTISVPTGVHWLTAVTVDGEAGMPAPPRRIVAVTPPQEVRTQRRGNRLLVSWRWPMSKKHLHAAAQAGAAEKEINVDVDVTWTMIDGQSRSKTIGYSDYRENHGFYIDDAATVQAVYLVAQLKVDGKIVRSGPAGVKVEAVPPTVGYTVKLGGGLFSPKQADFTVTSVDYSGDAEFTAVASSGSYMPASVDDGLRVGTFSAALSPGVPVEQTLKLPKLPKPFWIRLFAGRDAGFAVQDPPIDQLKG